MIGPGMVGLWTSGILAEMVEENFCMSAMASYRTSFRPASRVMAETPTVSIAETRASSCSIRVFIISVYPSGNAVEDLSDHFGVTTGGRGRN